MLPSKEEQEAARKEYGAVQVAVQNMLEDPSNAEEPIEVLFQRLEGAIQYWFKREGFGQNATIAHLLCLSRSKLENRFIP